MDVDSEKILTYCRATLVHLDHQLWSNVEPTCLLRQVASDCWLWLRLPLSYRLRRGCGCSTEDQPYAERMVGGWIIFEILHWGPSSRILDREKSMYVIYYNIVHQKNLLNTEANLEQCGPPMPSPHVAHALSDLSRSWVAESWGADPKSRSLLFPTNVAQGSRAATLWRAVAGCEEPKLVGPAQWSGASYRWNEKMGRSWRICMDVHSCSSIWHRFRINLWKGSASLWRGMSADVDHFAALRVQRQWEDEPWSTQGHRPWRSLPTKWMRQTWQTARNWTVWVVVH